MAARKTGEQIEKISLAYLGTMSALYDEIKKVENSYGKDTADMEEFYSGLLDGRKEVYEAAKKMYEAESSKDNSLRLKWSGAMCAMVATGKAACTGPATRESVLDIMKWKFGIDGETALDALESAAHTGMVHEYDGCYRLG